jgi:hypothetical protein
LPSFPLTKISPPPLLLRLTAHCCSRSGISASPPSHPPSSPLPPLNPFLPSRSYVPIKSDYSDLLDVSAFFIGLPDGSNAHDQLAKRIGAQGKKWADEHFREVDIAAYLFRLCTSFFLVFFLYVVVSASTEHDQLISAPFLPFLVLLLLLLLSPLIDLEYARLLQRDEDNLHSMDYSA